ncbi:uncharacterized protein BO97DRAFT_406191 [Aspergillus homomorphus CBS 101889]|uniref:Uncharacterized protein n=1 Tax=Aspergillus homomorphus (strain CBS 101889) TaxID=1450537 RepID=A0A395HVV8_ASPHC|nr:hypothetical protein BO97DRAFT_406191 [Aspergillus homomorphus CBS 101889]RAL11553.1 hypothetical protein BO97DRAFT_406191 [Aspergillus homomorphus CBS 101889]
MGNICSKSSNEPDAFARPGRVLGANDTTNTTSAATTKPSGPRASLPKSHSSTNWGSGPSGRTVGGDGTAASTPGKDNEDARAKAALAAQKRAESANNTASKGKLGSKLAEQRAQTQAQTLVKASQDEIAARDADGAAEARRWE